jgi:uncharacterized protein YecT (DUF1311 family)
MRSYLPLFLASALVLGGSKTPCIAQHVNNPGGPCQHAGPDAMIGGCFSRAKDDADRTLNVVYAQILAVLEPKDRLNLVKAERVWLQYRDATCAAESGLYDGAADGMRSTVRVACLDAETRQRLNDLHASYDWKVQKSQP